MPIDPLVPQQTQQPQGLKELSEQSQAVMKAHYQNWLDAGLNNEGVSNDETAYKFVRDYKTAVEGQKDGHGNIIKPPTILPIEGIDLKKTPEIKKTLGEKAGDFAVGASKAITGVPIGVAEAVNQGFNPVNIPYNFEVLGKGLGITAGKLSQGEGFHPLDALSEASQNTAMPNVTLQKDMIPAYRAGVGSFADLVTGKYSGGLSGITDRANQLQSDFQTRFKEESAAQNLLQNDPNIRVGETAGELGTAAVNLAQMVKGMGPAAKQLVSKIDEIRQSLRSGSLDWSRFKNSQEAVRQILGDLPTDLKKALFERTDQVKKLLSEGKTGAFDTVKEVRAQLATNKQILGEAVGELRNAVTTGAPEQYDPKALVKTIDDLVSKSKFSGGESSLDPKDLAVLERFKNVATNNNQPLTTRDASILVSKIDDHLSKQGYWDGENRTATNKALHEIRRAVDAEIADRYPAYKEVKLRWQAFEQQYQRVKGRIENLNAESFFSNIFGANKTETREIVEDLMNQGKETADAFKGAVNDAKNISSTNQNYNDAVVKLKEMAGGLKTRTGQDLMNELANKAIARRLANLADKDSDELRAMIRTYVDNNVKKAESYGSLAGGGVLGYVGQKTGGPVAAGALGLAGAKVGGQIGGAAGKAYYTRKADKIFNVYTLLDKIAREQKKLPVAAEFADKVLWLSKTLGEGAADAFLAKVPMSGELGSQLKTGFDAVLAGAGAAGGAIQATKGRK